MSSNAELPSEVELVYEVMPCNALRVAQEPKGREHSCAYFRKWGTYHSYDYAESGAPLERGIIHNTRYVGRATLVPEILSGCRKAPIVSVGINPNLPGWWGNRRNSLNPLFDDYRQYAHYFRYRSIDKLEVPRQDYQQFGGGAQDTPFSDFEMDVPVGDDGNRPIPVQRQPVQMYEAYQSLLDSLAEEMGWGDHSLAVGEDLAYGNMVACPSARWTTRPVDNDPDLPPMTQPEMRGIVRECFRDRQYFLRQLFQTLPRVILVFSQSTANAFLGEMQGRFSEGDPQQGESIADLMSRPIRLLFGDLSAGNSLEARVIFAPHITGDPANFGPARAKVVEQLAEEARAGRLKLNPQTKHLRRPEGGCRFCTMLDIGQCDYEKELQPLADAPQLAADSGEPVYLAEKDLQNRLIQITLTERRPLAEVWDSVDDSEDASAIAASMSLPTE
jgi:hypothetical protein